MLTPLSAPRHPGSVTPAHSRPKNGVASLAYDAGVHTEAQQNTLLRLPFLHRLMDCRVSPLRGGPAMTAEGAERVYLIASGLTGEPTPPVIGMAGATNRNS